MTKRTKEDPYLELSSLVDTKARQTHAAIERFNSAVVALNHAREAIAQGYADMGDLILTEGGRIRAQLTVTTLVDNGLDICERSNHHPKEDMAMQELGVFFNEDLHYRAIPPEDLGPDQPSIIKLCREHTFQLPNWKKPEAPTAEELDVLWTPTRFHIVHNTQRGKSIMDILEIPTFSIDPKVAAVRQAAHSQGISYSRPMQQIKIRE